VGTGYKWESTPRVANSTKPQGLSGETVAGEVPEIGSEAIRIESRTNLLFSFEKMAIRDALKSGRARGLSAKVSMLFYAAPAAAKLNSLAGAKLSLGFRANRAAVLTWPVATVFGFIAQPEAHIFLKPTVTRAAAKEYGFDFRYRSGPSWESYSSLLAFAGEIETRSP